MKFTLTLITVFFLQLLHAQVPQGKLLSTWNDNSLPSSNNHDNRYNEVWGVVQDGKEYAIIGSTWGTHFIDVTDPNNAVEVDRVKGATVGPSVVHRDYHDYNGYLYAVCDEGGASTMQIFDLSTLPDSATLVYDSFALIRRSHNIFIDTTTALLYGAISFGPFIVLDISEPANPKKVASYTNIEGFQLPAGSHDLYVRDGIAYINAGYQGLIIADFTKPDSAKLVTVLSTSEYPQAGYNHSGWVSTDGNYYYMADENHGFAMKVLNLTELPDLKIEGVFDAEAESPKSIPHNQVVAGDYLYVSYYFDGLQVYDISNPATPIRVMHYPTSTRETQDSKYQGAWGVYPLLPSGNILVSDMQEGLFVVEAMSKLTATEEDKTNIQSEITISPNPTTSSFNIVTTQSNFISVELIDMQGKTIQSWLPMEEYQLAKNIPSGTYFVKIRSDNSSQTVLMSVIK